MARNSFVLRWEIDKMSQMTSERKAESPVMNEEDFDWKASLRPNSLKPAKAVDFVLHCDYPGGGRWSCVADVSIILHRRTGNITRQIRKTFTDKHQVLLFNGGNWMDLINPNNGFRNLDAIFVEFDISIVSSEIIDPNAPLVNAPLLPDLTKFCSPIDSGNITLIIGDKKLQVAKEFLAIHSPVFAAMFFGNFDENGKEEVEIKEIVYEEFIDLLQVIFPGCAKINDATVLHILALGDRFQMERVIDLAESHLLTSRKFSITEKLRFADQYRLAALRDSCLQTFRTTQHIGNLEKTDEYAQFSDSMKAAICDRVMTLINGAK